MGILLKKVHNILLYDAGQFYVKKQESDRIKICEIFCSKSLKEDLSIDTTFDPCYFSWDSPFKLQYDMASWLGSVCKTVWSDTSINHPIKIC